MSRVTRWLIPLSLATCLPAITPPVGPETVIWIGVRCAASRVISPPLDLITTAWSVTPLSLKRSRRFATWLFTTGLT